MIRIPKIFELENHSFQNINDALIYINHKVTRNEEDAKSILSRIIDINISNILLESFNIKNPTFEQNLNEIIPVHKRLMFLQKLRNNLNLRTPVLLMNPTSLLMFIIILIFTQIIYWKFMSNYIGFLVLMPFNINILLSLSFSLVPLLILKEIKLITISDTFVGDQDKIYKNFINQIIELNWEKIKADDYSYLKLEILRLLKLENKIGA